MKIKEKPTALKLVAAVLSFLMISSVLPYFAVTASAAITPSTPQKDSSGVYQIGTAEELYWFADKVNNDNANYGSANAVLTADIVVNTNVLKADGNLADDTSGFTSWTPIGNFSNKYTGKFDGQGHTVSGLYFNDTHTDYVGLFGFLAENSEIKNVGVIDSYFKGNRYVGGVCGYDYGTITGCYNTGTVSGIGYYVGGVCGWNNGTITGCYNTGVVRSVSYFVGGVCGYNNYGTITGCYNTGTVSGSDYFVGGVCGENNYGTITGCYNTGTVSGTGYFVGGVCGRNCNGPITDCYNTGTVSGSIDYVGGVCAENIGTITGCYNTGTVSGKNYVGGVCGLNNGPITDCYNTGTVSGTSDNVGGVCGWNNKPITGCYSTGKVGGKNYVGGVCGVNLGTMTGCYNTGTVSGTNHVGGVCGYNYEGTITGCYTNNKGICGENSTGTVTDCVEHKDAEFANGTVCGLLNTALKNANSDVRFYQGVESPEFIHAPQLVDGVYQISSAAELYWFADKVNNDNANYGSANAVLTADIVVNTDVLKADGTLNTGTFTDWTPIGYRNSSGDDVVYSGKFDGQGHTISGLYFNNTNTDCVGLFGYLGSSGEIKNVGVIDLYFKGYVGVGGVCGLNESGTITGCYNTGKVSGGDGALYVGGVCGYNYNGTITGCYNTGAVSGSNYVGGVCGYNELGTITGCYTNNKDICGHDNGTATDCVEYTGDEFINGTVCGLLNTALQNANSDVRFYQGANYPKLCVIPKSVNGVYQVSCASELYGFAQLVNSKTEPSAKAVLTADIVVNTGVLKADGIVADDTSGFTSWTPIGNKSNKYTGTFDGQGHTVSGLYFNNTNTDYVGLFGYLGSGGEIKDVGVIDSYFKGNRYVGGVCGYNYGTITGCYNTSTFRCSGYYVGGVCGYNEATITGCYNTGTVNGTVYVGGVCGRNTINGTITVCYNTGTVRGSGNKLGGVCGFNIGTINGCYNTGTVNGTNYVGGVCGWNMDTGTITGCYNTGTVSGYDDYFGGVCGSNSGTMTGCYNTGTVGGTNYVGGVCGSNSGTMTGCYTNNGGVCEVDTGTAINCVEYTGDEFKDGTVCKLLNTALQNANSKVLFCQRIGTDASPLLTYQFESIDEHIVDTYTVDNNTFKAICFCEQKSGKTMELTLKTEKAVVVNGADNTLTATLSNYENEAVTYKWYQNDVEIQGETLSTYKMPADLPLGTYTYRVDVTMENVGTITQSVDVLVDITPQYYVNIPATVNIGDNFTVGASGVLLKNNAKLNVSLLSDFTLSTAKGASLNYEILNNSGKLTTGDTLLTVQGSQDPKAPGSGTSDTYNVALAQGEKPKYSGNYTDTLTFTIKVEP